MRTVRKRLVPMLLAMGALLGVFAAGRFTPGLPAPDSGIAAAPAPQGKGKDPREADRAAIRKAIQSFIKAFESGDAKAVAAHWTADGEYVTDDGTVLRGRDAIEKAYAEHFGKNSKHKVEIEVESI